MLKTDLIHPDILAVLASAGHHSKVLIADGNYPVASKLGPNAEIVHLNFMPGLLSCDQVLKGLLTAIAVEEGHLRADLDASQFAFEMHGVILSFHFQRRLLEEPNARQRTRAAFERLLASARPVQEAAR